MPAEPESEVSGLVTDLAAKENTVVHGATAGTARPAGATVVHWIGSVQPTNAATNDEWTDTTNKLVKRYNGSTWDTLGGAGGITQRFGMGVLYPRSGSFFQPTGQRAFSSITPTTNRLSAHLVVLGKTITLSQLSVSVGTAGDASSVIRLGVYSDNGDCYPGALLLDAGTVSTAATGTAPITVSQSLPAGAYWFCAVAQNVTSQAALVGAQLSDGFSYLFGDIDANPGWIFAGTSAGSQNTLASYWLQNSVTGALPANFSTTLTPGGGASPAPLIVGKAA